MKKPRLFDKNEKQNQIKDNNQLQQKYNLQLKLPLRLFSRNQEKSISEKNYCCCHSQIDALVFEAACGLLISQLPTLVNETPAFCSSDGH